MHLCKIISWFILAEVGAEEAVQGRCSIGASRLAVGWRRHPGLGGARLCGSNGLDSQGSGSAGAVSGTGGQR